MRMVIINRSKTVVGSIVYLNKSLICISIFIFTGLHQVSYASSTMSDDEVNNVVRAKVTNESDRNRLSIAAGLLADYEIAAKKLVTSLEHDDISAAKINRQANQLLNLSENVIKSAQFRLPQCDEYLAKTLALKNSLHEISHDTLEKDYHHDGALPKAPGECYHTKDLFVHPANCNCINKRRPVIESGD